MGLFRKKPKNNRRGHNASSKGFQETPKVKPVAPTPSPLSKKPVTDAQLEAQLAAIFTGPNADLAALFSVDNLKDSVEILNKRFYEDNRKLNEKSEEYSALVIQSNLILAEAKKNRIAKTEEIDRIYNLEVKAIAEANPGDSLRTQWRRYQLESIAFRKATAQKVVVLDEETDKINRVTDVYEQLNNELKRLLEGL